MWKIYSYKSDRCNRKWYTENSTDSWGGVPQERIWIFFGWASGVSRNNWRREPTRGSRSLLLLPFSKLGDANTTWLSFSMWCFDRTFMEESSILTYNTYLGVVYTMHAPRQMLVRAGKDLCFGKYPIVGEPRLNLLADRTTTRKLARWWWCSHICLLLQ